MTEKKKDCMFQFSTETSGVIKIVKDTDLITFDEAKQLWNKSLDEFKECVEKEGHPEMVIWIKCDNAENYVETFEHIRGSNVTIEHGKMYIMKPAKIY